jgi:hypothetical protein
METNVKILKTIVANLRASRTKAASYTYDETKEKVRNKKDALIKDVDYSISLIDTIISIEEGDTDENIQEEDKLTL